MTDVPDESSSENVKTEEKTTTTVLSSNGLKLFVFSLLSLYFELLIIRWLSSEIRIFAYFKNIPLIACLFGLGVGLATAKVGKDWSRFFPIGLAIITAIICFAEPLGLVHISFVNASEYYIIGGILNQFLDSPYIWQRSLLLIPALAVLLAVFYLIVFTFLAMGQRLGKMLNWFEPLTGYSINVAGSLTGIVLFTFLSFLSAKPWMWLGLGVLLCLWFYKNWLEIAFLLGSVALAFAIATTQPNVYWSPYYRIDVDKKFVDAVGKLPEVPWGYTFRVNHDVMEAAVDLSPAFIDKLPEEQRGRLFDHYDLIYKVINRVPGSVLILASGDGDDAAAALRNGVNQIDCVEIDPEIVRLAKELHPEHPYSSPKVTVHVNDARAYMRNSRDKYDFVNFAYLDSHAALSSMSSIRLDNYVYTVESFRDALRLLKPNGIICVTFYPSSHWQIARVHNAFKAAVGEEPIGVWSTKVKSITFFAGPGLNRDSILHGNFDLFHPEQLEKALASENATWDSVEPTTDDWPFLFLRRRAIDLPYMGGLLLALLAGFNLIQRTLKSAAEPQRRTLFCLGAAFMLIEVKSVSQIALLLGTTWLVNSAIIAGVLIMILLANWIVRVYKPKNEALLYAVLIALLVVSYLIPLSVFAPLSFVGRLTIGSLFLSLPLLFAAIIFALTFNRVTQPASALGVNLLGALVGGVLEYASLLTGISALNLIAAVLYSLAFYFSPARAGKST
jgi:SAM-dependent methyltransferase